MDFSLNFRKTIDFAKKNSKDYVKTDTKYIFFLLVVFVISSLVFVYLILSPNLVFHSDFTIILLVVLLGFLLIAFLSNYILNWLQASKSYHLYKSYGQPNSDYINILEETKKYRLRLFSGYILSSIIQAVPIGILFLVYIYGLFLFISGGRPMNFFFFMPFLFLGGIMIIGLFLVPLSLYPAILLIEPDIGYFAGIKKCFKLVPGWKEKFKLYILQTLLSYIISFVLQFILIGMMIVGFILIPIINVIFLNNISDILALFILELIIILIIFIVMSVEAQSIVMGPLFGQVYVNQALPELMKTDQYKMGKNVRYCIECGQKMESHAKFCINCGLQVE